MDIDIQELRKLLEKEVLKKEKGISSELQGHLFQDAPYSFLHRLLNSLESESSEVIWRESEIEPEIDVEARDAWEKKVDAELINVNHRLSELESGTPSQKVVIIEEMDKKTAKEKVCEYMKKHEKADIEELMIKLKIELGLLIEIIDELKRENKIVKA